MYPFMTTHHGIPSKEFERQLGVTYKTAWHMAHTIRDLTTRIDIGPLVGEVEVEVEVDESYVSGQRLGTTGGGAKNKTIALDIEQRGGNMVAMNISDVKSAPIQPLIKQYVQRESTVRTDKWWGYPHLRDAGFYHRTVRHGADEYARDGMHTNRIENFWARRKLTIRGTHIHVSPKYLPKYLTELSFRYNYRNMPNRMSAVLAATMVQPV